MLRHRLKKLCGLSLRTTSYCFAFFAMISTANASETIYKCYDHSNICLICQDNTDYVYFKVVESFTGNKLYYRRDGRWKRDCTIGNDCSSCQQEVTDDSFICHFPDSRHLSHMTFDLVSNTLSRVSRKPAPAGFSEKDWIFKCSKVK